MVFKIIVALILTCILLTIAAGQSGPECPEGYFGEKCAGRCHCESKNCDQVSGICSSGGCTPGYNAPDCQKLTGSALIKSAPPPIYNSDGSISLSCIAGGIPRPTVELSNANGLSADDLQAKTTSIELGEFIHATNLTFTLPETNDTDVYMFRCKTDNRFGMDTRYIEVHPKPPPVLKHPPIVDDVTSDSVTLTWAPWQHGVDEGWIEGDDIKYQPSYRPLGQVPWSFASNWTKETSATITNLWPDTEYEIAVRSSRSGGGGVGEPGNSNVVGTDCDQPDDNSEPCNFTADLVGNDSAILTWQTPKLIDLKCRVNEFILTIIKEEPEKEDLSETVYLGNQTEKYILGNLTVGTHYHIIIKAGTKFLKPNSSSLEDERVSYLGSESHISFEAGDPEKKVKHLNEKKEQQQ